MAIVYKTTLALASLSASASAAMALCISLGMRTSLMDTRSTFTPQGSVPSSSWRCEEQVCGCREMKSYRHKNLVLKANQDVLFNDLSEMRELDGAHWSWRKECQVRYHLSGIAMPTLGPSRKPDQYYFQYHIFPCIISNVIHMPDWRRDLAMLWIGQ